MISLEKPKLTLRTATTASTEPHVASHAATQCKNPKNDLHVASHAIFMKHRHHIKSTWDDIIHGISSNLCSFFGGVSEAMATMCGGIQ